MGNPSPYVRARARRPAANLRSVRAARGGAEKTSAGRARVVDPVVQVADDEDAPVGEAAAAREHRIQASADPEEEEGVLGESEVLVTLIGIRSSARTVALTHFSVFRMREITRLAATLHCSI